MDISPDALPFLKKIYMVKPTDRQIVQGIAAVYFSLNDMEQHVKYMDVLRDLKNQNPLINNSIEIYSRKENRSWF